LFVRIPTGRADDVCDWVCDHEADLGGRGIEVVILGVEAAMFAEQLMKARNELLTTTSRTGRSK
jgi:hypothetical protein